jgi:hypothetical protein
MQTTANNNAISVKDEGALLIFGKYLYISFSFATSDERSGTSIHCSETIENDEIALRLKMSCNCYALLIDTGGY